MNKKYKPETIAKTIKIEELYDLDVSIARFILPRLMVFKEHCERTPNLNMSLEEWKDILDNVGHYGSRLMPLHAVGSVIGVFAVCTLIDMARIRLIEKPFFRLWDRVFGA